jgi:hypothetical protein
MPDIDIEQQVEAKVRQDFAGTGLTLKGFDFEDLTVSLVNIVYAPSPTTVTPFQVDRETIPNCTTSPVTQSYSVSYARTTTFSASLSVGIDLGETTTAGLSLDVPPQAGASANLSAGETVSRSGSLGGTVSVSYTRNDTVSKSTSLTVAPCSQIVVTTTASRVTYSGIVTANVQVQGLVTFSAYLPGGGGYLSSGDVTYPIQMTIPVSGAFTGLGGTDMTIAPVQSRAQCPPGSDCDPATLIGPGTGTGTTGTGTGTGTGATPVEDIGPNVLYECGEDFPVVGEGTGFNDQAAQQAAEQNADAEARPLCPGRCPTRRLRIITVRFSDAPGGARRAKVFASYKCGP